MKVTFIAIAHQSICLIADEESNQDTNCQQGFSSHLCQWIVKFSLSPLEISTLDIMFEFLVLYIPQLLATLHWLASCLGDGS